MEGGAIIRTLGDYSKPSHEGYRSTIEIPNKEGIGPLKSDTIRLVQNECSFHGLRSEDPHKHLKDFIKITDSIDLNDATRETTRLRLFQFSLRDEASNWLGRLAAGSITTWGDLVNRFLAQFFPPGRTAALRNDILRFKQQAGESMAEAWDRFKDLIYKVPHHGIERWLLIQTFYFNVSVSTRRDLDYSAGGSLLQKTPDEAWETIDDLAFYEEEEGWYDYEEEVPLDPDYPDTERLLSTLEQKVEILMANVLSRDEKPREVLAISKSYQNIPSPSREEEFHHITTKFLRDQDKEIKGLEKRINKTRDKTSQTFSETYQRPGSLPAWLHKLTARGELTTHLHQTPGTTTSMQLKLLLQLSAHTTKH